jgi:hypothetical protein
MRQSTCNKRPVATFQIRIVVSQEPERSKCLAKSEDSQRDRIRPMFIVPTNGTDI